jgi:hypothetical protein
MTSFAGVPTTAPEELAQPGPRLSGALDGKPLIEPAISVLKQG